MNRSKALTLAPGQLHSPTLPLSRYRQSWVSGAVKAYAESLLTPASTVLVLGNGHGNTIRELYYAGHKVIALNPNPIPLLWMHCQLNPVPPETIQSAFNTIAYSRHIGQPLVKYIQNAYATQCPNCHQTIQLNALLWDRDTQRPYERELTCPHCETSGTFPITEADYDKHREFEDKLRPAHIFTMQQIAPPKSFFRQRAEENLKLYSPRNLTVLGTIIRQLSHACDDTDVKRVLACLLLQALDRGSYLNPVSDPDGHPRSFRLTSTYRENNVWLTLNDTLQAYRETISLQNATPVPGTTLSSLLNTPEPGYVLLARPLDYLNTHGNVHGLSGAIWHIAPPDAVFTSLSALWAGWLWGSGAIKSMRKLLERRRHDLQWFETYVETQCNTLRPMLADQASVALIVPQTVPEVITCVRRAFDKTGYKLQHWTGTYAGDSYLLYTKVTATGEHSHAAPHITDHAQTVIKAQHQPVPVPFIAASYAITWPYAPPANIKTLYDDSRLHIEDDKAWPVDSAIPQSDIPLYDRVEASLLEHLRSQPTWTETDLLLSLYTQFNGIHSPQPGLVQACLDSYTVLNSRDELTLRKEDEIALRKADGTHNQYLLKTLGERLLYRVYGTPNGDTIWQDGTRCAYRFRILSTGMVAGHLLHEKPQCEGRCCLVIPGGRAGLIAHKLSRDPSLRVPVEQRIWTFIKFRHLRRMVEEIAQRSDIEVYLGLDPIAEQTQAQIPLSLH